MSPSLDWSLFGFDLSLLVARLRLGWHQLLWGDEAGLRARFCPSPNFISPNLAQQGLEQGASFTDIYAEAEHVALVIPESKVLQFRFVLPVAAEAYMEAAVMAQVAEKTPFLEEQTAWGFQLVERLEGEMAIDIAIISVGTLDTLLRSAQTIAENSDSVDIEIWAKTAHGAIPIKGYEGKRRRFIYFQALRSICLRGVAAAFGVFLLIYTIPAWFTQSAGFYESLRVQAEQRAAEAVNSRSALLAAREQEEEALTFLTQYADYRPWLHKVAQLTPDSIYLNRFSIEGRSLVMSGIAENAAEFQSALAATDLFDDLSSPSAFTRDSRAGGERFTLTMSIPLDTQQ